MLKIDAGYVDAVARAESGPDLYESLQKAVELEHSTIPPYLLAAYSLVDGQNSQIRDTLIDIAKEEMLHMAIVCNVLNAIGGRPRIGEESFLPKYPGPLPMGISGGLQVGLRMYSPDLVHEVFMKIEKPERPIPFGKVRKFFSRMLFLEQYSTIGTFYQSVIDKIEQLGDTIFTGDPERQVAGLQNAGFPTDLLYPITNAQLAVRALRWLVQDGEGTTASPQDASGRQLAHYYRFAEIHHGRALVAQPQAPDRYAYVGDPIPFEAQGVNPFPDDPKVANLPEGSLQRRAVDRFNKAYCNMLRSLDRVFDGDPGHIGQTNSDMVRLRTYAAAALGLQDSSGTRTGLSFEYVPP